MTVEESKISRIRLRTSGDFANYDKITEFDIFRNLIYANLEIRFIKRVLYLNTCLIKYGAPLHQKK